MSSIKHAIGFPVGLIMILFLFVIQPTEIILAGEGTATPSPSPLTFPAPIGLSDLFACPSEKVVGDGPVWRGIEVGVSELQDLEQLLPDTSETETDIEIISETPESQLINYGSQRMCIQENIIVTRFAGQLLPNLSDFVTVYGVPDAVTWTPTYNTRIVFWFESGIAVEVLTTTTDTTNSSWGYVIRTIFFPYQKVEGFEHRWPFNATEPRMPSLLGIGDEVPTEQNPFDFEAMVATITAEPSRTPTPTLTSRASMTSVPTPTASP